MYKPVIFWVIAFLFSLLIVVIHIVALRSIQPLFEKGKPKNVLNIAVGTSFILGLHIISVIIYGIIYLILANYVQEAKIVGANEFRDYVYFSIASYTTLGIGDLYPTGVARIFSGVEAIVGLGMIGWTVTFSYKYAMKKR